MKTASGTFLAVLAVLALAACTRTQVASPIQTTYEQQDTTAELDFWHELADRPVTTNNEAVHGLIVLANGHDPNDDYATRLAWLRDNGYLSAGVNESGAAAVERGTVAHILAQMLDIKGGLTMRIIGPHPRYAMRELTYMDLMPYGSPQQGMTGIEFLDLVAKAQDYMERDS